MNKHAKALGKLGGEASAKVKSTAKAEASRRNGKLGGRPSNEAKKIAAAFMHEMKKKIALRNKLMKDLGLTLEEASKQVWPDSDADNEYGITVTRKDKNSKSI